MNRTRNLDMKETDRLKQRRCMARCAVLVAVLLAARLATGAVIEVSSLADAGTGSLRQAISDAAPGDVISLSNIAGTIALTSGSLMVRQSVSIVGPRADVLAISGSGLSRVLTVDDGAAATTAIVIVRGVAIKQGVVSGGNGGAVFNAEDLTLVECSLMSNTAIAASGTGGNGGAIFNLGSLALDRCAVIRNVARNDDGSDGCGNGGGIFNAVDGTGVYHGTLVISNATLSGNQAIAANVLTNDPGLLLLGKRGFGGGLFNDADGFSAVMQTNGARVTDYIGVAACSFCTIADNHAAFGGGVFNNVFVADPSMHDETASHGQLAMDNCIVSANTASLDTGRHSSHDVAGCVCATYSLATHISGVADGPANQCGIDALLLPLAHNGGPTMTHALRPDSPALCGGSPDAAANADQSCVTRRFVARPDIGALHMPRTAQPLSPHDTATVTTPAGDTVGITLHGDGAGTVYTVGGSNACEIVLSGTTARSVLAVKGGKGATLRGIRIAGGCKAIAAKGVALRGILACTGSLDKAVLGGITESSVSIGGAGGKGTVFQCGDIAGLDFSARGPVRLFRASSWSNRTDRASFMTAQSVGVLKVDGWLDGVRALVDNNIGVIVAGGMRDCDIHAGVARGALALPLGAQQFGSAADIGLVRVTGAAHAADGAAFINSDIVAAHVGKVKLANVRTDNGDITFGAMARTQVDSVQIGVPTGAGGWKWQSAHDSTATSMLVRADDFAAGTVAAAQATDLPFHFAMGDDSRAPLSMGGAAMWNIVPMFNDAYQQNCAFMILPGDIVAGGLCLGSASWADLQYRGFFSSQNQHYRDLGTNIFAVRGNHECYFDQPWTNNLNRTKWLEYFGNGMPQDGPVSNALGLAEQGFSYSFSYGNAFFIGLDQYCASNSFDGAIVTGSFLQVPTITCADGCTWDDGNGMTNGNWLAARIDAYHHNADLDHCFLFGHSPLYKSLTRTDFIGNGHEAQRDALLAAVNGAAEVFFCGHDHFYDHTVISNTSVAAGSTGIDAMHQILAGTIGANIDWDALSPDDPHCIRDPNRQYCHDAEHMGYSLVTVAGRNVRIAFRIFAVDHAEKWWEIDQVGTPIGETNVWTYTIGGP